MLCIKTIISIINFLIVFVGEQYRLFYRDDNRFVVFVQLIIALGCVEIYVG